MSSAHRPTWDPAQGKDTRSNSRIYSSRDIAAHTRLKFRQPGQGTKAEVERRDLKAELLMAERESADRKAKGQAGYVADRALLMLENQQQQQQELEAAKSEAGAGKAQEANRRKILEQASALDADDDDDDDDEDRQSGADSDDETSRDKGKGKAVDQDLNGSNANGSDDDDDSDSDDDEDETAELLRELEKIKKERAEEKERQERERLESEQTNREEEIAMGNPLLNLQAALGHNASPSPSLSSSTSAASSSFGVKRRWDDDVIFKNQAPKDEQLKPEFVNDLLRTQYHRKFIKRYIA